MTRGWVGLQWILLCGGGFAGPIVSFENEDGEGRQKAATVRLESGLLASVTTVGAISTTARLGEGGDGSPLQVVIHDEVSRLTLLKEREAEGGEEEQGAESGGGGEAVAGGGGEKEACDVVPVVGASVNLKAGDAVYLDPKDLEHPSRVVSWEEKYRDILLPLSLMRVHHPGETVPLPGAPLFDAKGRLVAICHQAAPEFGLGTYALPVEVIARVEKDLKTSGKFVPSWIGIRLDVEHPVLSIRSVRKESPAAAAGIEKGDILLAVGEREVRTYADGVNALYYLVSGEEAVVRVLRGTETREVKVVPEVVPPTPAPVPE